MTKPVYDVFISSHALEHLPQVQQAEPIEVGIVAGRVCRTCCPTIAARSIPSCSLPECRTA